MLYLERFIRFDPGPIISWQRRRCRETVVGPKIHGVGKWWTPSNQLDPNECKSGTERVTDIVAEQLGVDKEKISGDTSFANDLGADSLDTVELVMELEEEFNISIPDDAAEKIQTVGQAVEYIEQHSDD
jgi:acyl carrier protein